MVLNNVRAAYLIRHDACNTVHELLDAAGLVVAADSAGPTQIPRYLVSARTPAPAASSDRLSTREIQVLLLVAAGLENPEIGESLHLSTDTIKTHMRRMFRKLGARGRANAVHIAHQRGILGGA
jgi:DNA-binding NarL/FixJ family response regulator